MMGMRSNEKKTTRCDLCHKTTDYPYQVVLGQHVFKFCGGAHANQAARNYQEKLDKGITPSIANLEVEEDEAE